MKLFTPQEASKTLPLVRKIVADILDTGKKIRVLVFEASEGDNIEPRLENLKAQISAYIDELTEVGCLYKDWNFEVGLIDFPGIIEGRHVYLCWRSDEESLQYYHDLDAGYKGRKEIPEKYFD